MKGFNFLLLVLMRLRSEKKKFRIKKKITYLSDRFFFGISIFSTFIGIIALLFLIVFVFKESIGWLNFDFITGTPSRFAHRAGIFPLIMGSISLVFLVAIFSLPLGVFAAIYLEEYAPDSKLKRFIEINISNLAGIPSIVFGLLGLGIFVNALNLGPGILLVGSLTLSIRVLPIVIISTQEAIRAVPSSHREASYGIGASQWETIRYIVLPKATASIMTGLILALAGAIGETAPLIMVGVATSIFMAPTSILSSFGALPLQIYAWSDYPQADFQHGVTPAAIVVLLIILILFNMIALFIRRKFQNIGTN